ncbi:MAG: HAD family hydrolase [Angustibacter sp.]
MACTPLPSAVLWDMDGTLVDTESYWMAAERELVERHGGTWSAAHGEQLVGLDLLLAAEYIRRHGPVPLEPERIVRELLAVVVVRFREQVPWRPGARELLTALRATGVPCALVTMSWTELADELVAALPPGTFDAVVTGDVVRRGKPHPDPYLMATTRLGVDPAQCLAVEDSVPGVTSALAAGIPTLVVPNVVDVPALPGLRRADTLVGLTPAALGDIAAGITRLGSRPRGIRSGHGITSALE